MDRPSTFLFWYDFLARPYDPTRGQFTGPDQKAEEYYSWNPFTFCINNPQKYVDPDGTKIIPYLFTEMDESGNALGTPYLIYTKVKNAIIKIGQTTYGKIFLSAFIDEGAKNYGVRGNGRYSNYNFEIRQYNMKDPNEQYLMMRNNSGSLSYTEEEGALVVVLRLGTQEKTESQLIETILHEIALHGTKTELIIQAYKKGGMKAVNDYLKINDQYSEHHNLKIENRENKGVNNYIQAREELIKKYSNLKNIFEYEMAKYKENY